MKVVRNFKAKLNFHSTKTQSMSSISFMKSPQRKEEQIFSVSTASCKHAIQSINQSGRSIFI